MCAVQWKSCHNMKGWHAGLEGECLEKYIYNLQNYFFVFVNRGANVEWRDRRAQLDLCL